jgi:hypothetical protein
MFSYRLHHASTTSTSRFVKLKSFQTTQSSAPQPPLWGHAASESKDTESNPQFNQMKRFPANHSQPVKVIPRLWLATRNGRPQVTCSKRCFPSIRLVVYCACISHRTQRGHVLCVIGCAFAGPCIIVPWTRSVTNGMGSY